MAKKKLKKFLKGAAKAALIGGALYAGTKALGKRKLAKAVSGTDDAGIGVKHFPSYIKLKHPWDSYLKHIGNQYLLPPKDAKLLWQFLYSGKGLNLQEQFQ